MLDRAGLEALPKHLAWNLADLRHRRGLSQRALAQAAGLPRSTLGQLESGQANPTLLVLGQLARALQVSLEELLAPPWRAIAKHPAGSLPTRAVGPGGGGELRHLLPEPMPGMAIDRLALPPGVGFAGVPHRPGTREYLACEAGELELWAGGEQVRLAPGDVVAFAGDQPHGYRNPGRVLAVGFSVVVLVWGQPGPEA